MRLARPLAALAAVLAVGTLVAVAYAAIPDSSYRQLDAVGVDGLTTTG